MMSQNLIPGRASAVPAATDVALGNCIGLYCSVAGTLRAKLQNSAASIDFTVPAGAVIPGRFVAVVAAGTTGTFVALHDQ